MIRFVSSVAAFVMVLMLFSTGATAQIDLQRYVGEGTLPLTTFYDQTRANIKWDMTGPIQAELNEGLNNLDEENLRLAVGSFDKVAKMDSSLWVCYYFRGICYRKLGDLKNAEADFLHAIAIHPQEAETYCELGEVYALKGDFSNAAKQYDKAVNHNPSLVRGYYCQGNLALVQREITKALKYYQKCNATDPSFPQAYMMEGYIKSQLHKKDNEALVLFDKAIASDSSFSQTYFWRGLVYSKMEKQDRCLADWNTLLRYNPTNSFYHLMRGYLFIELNRFDEAFADLHKALRARELNEDRAKTQQTLLDKQIDLQVGLNYLIRTGYGLNSSSFVYLKKGFCLLLAGRIVEASNNFRAGERIQHSSTASFLSAIAHEQNKQHEAAYVNYNNALVQDNDIYDAHKKRAVYRFEMKDLEGAYKDIDDMFRLQPESMAGFRLRGLIKSNVKDYQGAISDLTIYLRSDTSNIEIIRTLAVCKAFVGDHSGAIGYLKRIPESNPPNWADRAEIAEIHLVMGDTIGAISIFQRIPDNEFVLRLRLAEVFVYRSDFKDAAKEVKKIRVTLRTAIQAFPLVESQTFFIEGLTALMKSDFEAAINLLTTALTFKQTNPETRYVRAKAYEKAKRSIDALNDYNLLRKLKYKDSENCYLRLGGK